jgi:hypothetical protein
MFPNSNKKGGQYKRGPTHEKGIPGEAGQYNEGLTPQSRDCPPQKGFTLRKIPLAPSSELYSSSSGISPFFDKKRLDAEISSAYITPAIQIIQNSGKTRFLNIPLWIAGYRNSRRTGEGCSIGRGGSW